MALKATVFKARLQISDMDRHYYGDHALTIARHPSETDERMMLRLLAFARHAHEDLAFGRGVSSDDDPDLWIRNLTGDIELLIQLGQPGEREIRRACSHARQVVLYTYSGQGARIWWEQLGNKLAGLSNLSIYDISPESMAALGQLTVRSMDLNITIQDGAIWVSDDRESVEVDIRTRL
ncbi:YaeQ family protein [Billgrantia kenyensis]|uniref:YaeQ family protein n=1 Tax=Billgrantia kenyensis TaxID=321266 RepID=A0A7V9VXZ1_9GAMM|nr:YaeQ family protein [Halomonas kenyensis]MBA2777440.1 YaeQ family protein [Halomonas kenyensis]MCG6660110.1 YaeQ family protein [Halomonas kenyensis]